MNWQCVLVGHQNIIHSYYNIIRPLNQYNRFLCDILWSEVILMIITCMQLLHFLHVHLLRLAPQLLCILPSYILHQDLSSSSITGTLCMRK